MLTLLNLTNRTLSELGKQEVNAITDSPDAQIVAAKLTELAPELLLAYEWNFAVVYRDDSAPNTVNFSPDYSYTYTLPGNYGRFFKWATTGAQWPFYAIMDNLLLANTNPVQYYYIVNDLPFSQWKPLALRALVFYAASECAPTLTQNESLTAYLYQKYQQKLVDAIRQNDMERSVQATPYNDFNRITFV